MNYPPKNIASGHKKNNKISLLLFIILIGIFSRTYNFKKTLTFAPDQHRDLLIIKDVIRHRTSWPLMGPNMTGGHGFRLGPIYYYFQIISAKIFGAGMLQQAYPDVFFSILSIPLLYYFLRKYFNQTVAILSVGVYAVSYFDIEYSRFAWNVNLLPFFVLLFLVSFLQFMIENEAMAWKWVVLAGLSLGIGVQLHAITLLLFPAIVFIILVYLFHIQKKLAWKKLLTILGIALILNATQLVNEVETGFSNTRDFKKAFIAQTTNNSFGKELTLDIACNAQANTHIISSMGNRKVCDFLYTANDSGLSPATPISLAKKPLYLAGEFVSLLFSILGIGFLAIHFKKEADRKKKLFLSLVILYSALYFIIMLSVAPDSQLRYYLPIIFLPFIFLAFIFDYLIKKYPHSHFWIISAILIFLLAANIYSLLFLPIARPY